jgi:hypothetical protein
MLMNIDQRYKIINKTRNFFFVKNDQYPVFYRLFRKRAIQKIQLSRGSGINSSN